MHVPQQATKAPRPSRARASVAGGVGLRSGWLTETAFSPAAAVTCGARRLGAALRAKPQHQITFAAKNLLNTNSGAVI
jgi:hypothetical protein